MLPTVRAGGVYQETIGGFRVRLTGGSDGHGGGRGPLVVLLHGFGVPGDDLVPLAHRLRVPHGTRFALPEGPLPLRSLGLGDALAWWMTDPARGRGGRSGGAAGDGPSPRGLSPAREKMLHLLRELEGRLDADPAATVLGGFSQGALLSLDVALHSPRRVAGVVHLSGGPLFQREWSALTPRHQGVPVFLSHGARDETLPYAAAAQLRDDLFDAGFRVDWVGFAGGHEIPDLVQERLGLFLGRVLGSGQ